jgi:hypothetical protein
MQPAEVKIRWGYVFLGIILIGIGLCVLGVRVAMGSVNGLQSLTWPKTGGIISRSELETTQEKGKTSYAARVAYDFYVNNNLFSGNTVYFGCCGGAQDEENAILQRYPLTSQVTVSYYPANPALSVLEPGVNIKDLLVFLFVGIFAIIAGGVILWTSRVKIYNQNDNVL